MLQEEHSAILSTFIKLPFVIKIFVLSIFEWPLYTGFAVYHFFVKFHTKTICEPKYDCVILKSMFKEACYKGTVVPFESPYSSYSLMCQSQQKSSAFFLC